ncbi:AAA family ATPase [Aquisediminimonas sediminicola]|uniref:bifunctional aminoglycoside phosphotransferase/ATP-binding protein n=1 Tax=Alteraquisediminimonas sediminicola TaxID=2676787 RepID=UPI001C8E7CDA|nr:AAA family ATPase [Aquisediminimonas sediminicola]
MSADDDQAEVIKFFASGAAFEGHPVVRRIDTHGATVFLTADRAWKLKRAVRFNYLDFSTAARRRAVLETELHLNRRTAPALYRAVHPITRGADGDLHIGGSGAAVDWVLEMVRFPDGALLSEIVDQVGLADELLLRLADHVVAFHRDAPIHQGDTGSTRFRRAVEGNVSSLAVVGDIFDPAMVATLVAGLRDATEHHAALLDQRAVMGRVRHLHGDLHLHNIALIDGGPTPFDCLEFDEDLATIDTLYDLAFLLMDLWHRDLHRAANLIFNRYLDLMAEDEAGIALMPLFLALRATIRAHVMAQQAARHPDDPTLLAQAQDFLALALHSLDPVKPRLIAVGGLSGSGKTTLAQALACDLGRAPGARLLRSDVLRKRLAGVAPETRLGPAAYAKGSSTAVYAHLYALAAAALGQQQAVIADAVFALPKERAAIAAVGQQMEVETVGIWLDSGEAMRVARVNARFGDASDADATIAAAQSKIQVGPLADWRVLDATGGADEVANRARRALGWG